MPIDPASRARVKRQVQLWLDKEARGEKVKVTRKKWADLDKEGEEIDRLIAERDEKNRPHLVAVKDSKP